MIAVRRPSATAPPRADGGRGAVYDVFDADGRFLGSTAIALDAYPAPQIVRGMIAVPAWSLLAVSDFTRPIPGASQVSSTIWL